MSDDPKIGSEGESNWKDGANYNWVGIRTPIEFELKNGLRITLTCPACQKSRVRYGTISRWREAKP